MMTGFERYTKKTKRALFLEEMEQVVPWRELCALIEPHYPKVGNGRPPIGVERMLQEISPQHQLDSKRGRPLPSLGQAQSCTPMQ